ncbi:pyrroline-5-carboxylate reductase family protein [Sphingomonas sp.]|uniref:pyrroline-5-carboxylate reductase family protein n=1 Tax=Sphingomonas sp. TaxID=28214 RepID=UPI003B002331
MRARIDELMAPLGLVEWLADERAMDAAAALAGSGPAFLYRFVDALALAGAADGLDVASATRLALATVEGAAALAVTSGEAPALLAERVASPGGSTRAGLDVLDHDFALRKLLAQTLAAARRRNAEMAAAAR